MSSAPSVASSGDTWKEQNKVRKVEVAFHYHDGVKVAHVINDVMDVQFHMNSQLALGGNRGYNLNINAKVVKLDNVAHPDREELPNEQAPTRSGN